MNAGAASRLRADNAELDATLLAAAAAIPPELLHVVPPGDEWSAAHVLAHLGEFPRFFAAELRRWHADPNATVGRTHEHAERLAAVSDSAVEPAALPELIDQARLAFADLADALGPLTDADLDAATHNVKHGVEPLTAFFDRYVTGHKASHREQLTALVAAARGADP